MGVKILGFEFGKTAPTPDEVLKGTSTSDYYNPQTTDASTPSEVKTAAIPTEAFEALEKVRKGTGYKSEADRQKVIADTAKFYGINPSSLRYVEGVGWHTAATFAQPGAVAQPSTRDATAAAYRAQLAATPGANTMMVDPGLNAMRQGAQIDQSGVNYAQVLGLGARNSQQDALALQRAAAYGQAPSVAAIQQQQGLDAALSSQFALANSARGGAAQRALAQSQAATQAGQMQQAAVNQAAALRAAEMATARDAYGTLGTNIRAGDVSQGTLAGMTATSQAQLNQQQALANQQVLAAADLANQNAFADQQRIDTARLLGLGGQLTGSDALTLQALQGNVSNDLALWGLKSDASQATGAQETAAGQQWLNLAGPTVNSGGAALSQLLFPK